MVQNTKRWGFGDVNNPEDTAQTEQASLLNNDE